MTSSRKHTDGDASTLVRRLWHYCNVLRDDGLSYPDYVEQLTYLLFLKMSDEQADGPVPAEYAWRSFAPLKDAEAMHRHYGHALTALGKGDGMLGVIFREARNKIRDPAKLRLLIVDLIGQTEWSGLSADVKGDAYEGLLEKNARDTKSGAGQYFTPRPLIEAIVECVSPQPREVVCDPACGTGGFLLAAREYILHRNPSLSAAQREHLRTRALRGVELVQEVARLATMNLLLHGVSGQADDELPIACADSLKEPPHEQVDVVLTNPPFGVRGSVTYGASARRPTRSAGDLSVLRPDFWVETANKQLNFLQHVVSLLKPGGRAAVVLPDNVLFESGAAASVRQRLLRSCDVHTLLRLPTGLFYAQGVKANVLFFDHPNLTQLPSGKLWVYDLRSENHFSLKARPLAREDLRDFVELYQPRAREHRALRGESPRWRAFERDQLLGAPDYRLDLDFSVDQADERDRGLSRLDEIGSRIADDLRHALSLISNLSSKR